MTTRTHHHLLLGWVALRDTGGPSSPTADLPRAGSLADDRLRVAHRPARCVSTLRNATDADFCVFPQLQTNQGSRS